MNNGMKACICAAVAIYAAVADGSDLPKIPKPDFGGAVPERPSHWLSDADVPAGEHGVVVISFGIGIDGRMSDCHVVQSSGFKQLDALPCKTLPKVMRFKPARDQNGNPVATHGTNSVRF
jgi:protein TonB